MHYVSFWQGALLLASVPVLHWVLLRRGLAVSGRLTALVDRVRSGRAGGDSATDMTEAELVAAIRAESLAAFGGDAVEPDVEPETAQRADARPARTRAETPAAHVLFFAGLALGGFASAMAAGGVVATPMLRGDLFAHLVGHSPALGTLVLFSGGMLVGFGTRMAGGCTSGHGLCGVSQLQKGSLLATMAFFGAGVITSLAIGALA